MRLDIQVRHKTRENRVNFIYGESDGDLSYYFNDYEVWRILWLGFVLGISSKIRYVLFSLNFNLILETISYVDRLDFCDYTAPWSSSHAGNFTVLFLIIIHRDSLNNLSGVNLQFSLPLILRPK